MNFNKRKIIFVSLIICIIALISGGTLAYFTAEETVTNRFMVTSYDPDNPNGDPNPEDLFSIKITETDKNGNETTEGNTYTNIAPGIVVSKDPTIQNTGAYSAWVRVKLVITNADDWVAAMQKHNINDIATLFGGYDASLWYRVDNDYILDNNNNTLTYNFYYNNVLKADEKVTLFSTFKIPEQFDTFDMASLAYFELKVTADAIQQANTGNSAYYAFQNYFD